MILQMEGSCDEIAQMISILNKVNEPKIQARERIAKTNKVIQDVQKEVGYKETPEENHKHHVELYEKNLEIMNLHQHNEKQEKEWAEQKELDERMDKILNPEETQESEPTPPQRKTMTKKERREKHSRSRVIDIFKKDSHGTFVREITVESVTAVAKHV